jgi:hypothetical protein
MLTYKPTYEQSSPKAGLPEEVIQQKKAGISNSQITVSDWKRFLMDGYSRGVSPIL